MKKSNIPVCFVLNPAANRERSVRHADWIREEAKKCWDRFEIVITNSDQSIFKLVREKTKTNLLIVACGGDGTVSQVADGLRGTRSTLGVLPMGSGNDFVKSLGLPKSLPECMDVLYTGKTDYIDLIQIEGDADTSCINTFGAGLDGFANRYASSFRRLRGKIIYLLSALKALQSYRGSYMELNIDGEIHSGEYLMITACNGKWEGGQFFVAPQADLKDGYIDLLLIKKMPVLKLIGYMALFKNGPLEFMQGIETYKCKKIEIQSAENLPVHCDGEQLDEIQSIQLSVRQGKLRVVVP